MGWVKFSVAVVLTSVALVIALFATGAFMVGNAVASSMQNAAQAHSTGFDSHNLPPELANLKDVPAAERFSHFKGVQVNLTDKDGKPLDIAVTPGVASNVSPTSVTIAGNDGATHTYTLDAQTFSRGPVATGDNVVVVTIDNASTARALISANGANWHHS